MNKEKIVILAVAGLALFSVVYGLVMLSIDFKKLKSVYLLLAEGYYERASMEMSEIISYPIDHFAISRDGLNVKSKDGSNEGQERFENYMYYNSNMWFVLAGLLVIIGILGGDTYKMLDEIDMYGSLKSSFIHGLLLFLVFSVGVFLFFLGWQKMSEYGQYRQYLGIMFENDILKVYKDKVPNWVFNDFVTKSIKVRPYWSMIMFWILCFGVTLMSPIAGVVPIVFRISVRRTVDWFMIYVIKEEPYRVIKPDSEKHVNERNLKTRGEDKDGGEHVTSYRESNLSGLVANGEYKQAQKAAKSGLGTSMKFRRRAKRRIKNIEAETEIRKRQLSALTTEIEINKKIGEGLKVYEERRNVSELERMEAGTRVLELQKRQAELRKDIRDLEESEKREKQFLAADGADRIIRKIRRFRDDIEKLQKMKEEELNDIKDEDIKSIMRNIIDKEIMEMMDK